tara:strand:- start:219 stop:329 length:111 start_codon:yes stop_codon:yes gene_type:complete
MEKIFVEVDITEKIKKISICDLIKIKIFSIIKQWKK